MDMEKEVRILNLDDILPNRFQPRIKFNEENIMELAESIKEHGVIQPIVVRKISDKFEIIAGERRYKASVLAGKTTIPAIVTNLDDKDSAEIALIENVQREDLTPIEEAISYKKILDMGYLNQASLAAKLGKTQSTIANKLRLLNLSDEVQEALLEGKISERHARSLLKLNEEKQVNMLNRIISERLTVRKADEEIDKLLNNSSSNANDAEILDFEETEDGNSNSNNVIETEFNIPVDSIIEEKPLEIEPSNNFEPSFADMNQVINSNLETNNEIKEENINPGFMDISKIEAEAKDIYQPEKETADLDALLVPTEVPVVNSEPEEEVETDSTPTGGRFFNMFNFSNREENPNFVNDLEDKEVNMDFSEPVRETSTNANIFDFNPIAEDKQPEVIEEEQPVITPEVKEEEKVSTFTPALEEQNINQIEESSPVEFEQPVVSNFFNPFNNQPALEPKEEENQVQFEQPQVTTEPNLDVNIFDNENTYNNTLEEQPVVESPTLVEEDPFTNQVNPVILNEEEEFTNIQPNNNIFGGNVVKQESKVDNYVTDYDFNDVKDTNDIDLPVQDFGKNKVSDLKMAINTIRDCAKTLEKYGFTVDTEELDFEDNYQVTFIIDKK